MLCRQMLLLLLGLSHVFVQSQQLPLIDCNVFCEFKGYWDIAARTKIARINLTSPVFKITFDYNIEPWEGDWGGVTGDNWRGTIICSVSPTTLLPPATTITTTKNTSMPQKHTSLTH